MSAPARLIWLGSWVLSLCLTGVQAQAEDLSTYTITLRNGVITPASLEVPSGKRVKLIVRNEGPGAIEFENLSMRVEKVLAPGAQSFVVLPAMRPGRYHFIDEFHPESAGLDVIAK